MDVLVFSHQSLSCSCHLCPNTVDITRFLPFPVKKYQFMTSVKKKEKINGHPDGYYSYPAIGNYFKVSRLLCSLSGWKLPNVKQHMNVLSRAREAGSPVKPAAAAADKTRPLNPLSPLEKVDTFK